MTDDPLAQLLPFTSDANFSMRLFGFAAREYRKHLTSSWIERSGAEVQFGPFMGLQLLQQYSWGDGDMLPKLLGTYEAELHPIIHEVVLKRYSLLINIGCAEGFYAVGLARCLPAAHIVAFDRDEHAQEICRRTATVNKVGDRVRVYGECTTAGLEAVLSESRGAFLLVDCEGAEIDILSPLKVPELCTSDMLIECHDFINRRITNILHDRLLDTHRITTVFESGRSPEEYAALKEMSSAERALATCEFRPALMHWLHCKSKALALSGSPVVG